MQKTEQSTIHATAKIKFGDLVGTMNTIDNSYKPYEVRVATLKGNHTRHYSQFNNIESALDNLKWVVRNVK